MNDIRKEPNFLYTQSSLAVFEACPYKFDLRYNKGVYWAEDAEHLKSFKKGNDFHLLAERYYLGIDIDVDMGVDEEVIGDIEKLKKKYPVDGNYKTFPEFEIRHKESGINLLGRYDLIILDEENQIKIIDFKTNKKKMDIKLQENSLQTMIYLFLLWENYNLISKKIEKIENLEMNYYQTEYPEELITIKYSDEKHRVNKKKIQKKIETINNFEFKNLEKQRVEHCNVCEFKIICWKN